MAALVRRHAVDNTIVVTFGNMRQAHLTENWVYHWRRLGVRGLLVGMMNMRPEQARYAGFATKLRAQEVGVYTVNSPQVKRNPQGGRWFHVLELIQTGARVLLSDSDVTWLRDPRPYFERLEAAHPQLDFTVSSDAQGGTDARRLAAPPIPSESDRRSVGGRAPRSRRSSAGGSSARALRAAADLDVEAFGHCWTSMNIGIMHFPPGCRPGTVRAMEQAVAHLSSENNLARVDQGPINYRWKFGAKGWRWHRSLYGVRDASGKRLCGLLNGTSVGGVLPSAQFCNTLTHSVLRLYAALQPPPAPFAVHATWMRQQREEYKLMRLREEGLWRDLNVWYGTPSGTYKARMASCKQTASEAAAVARAGSTAGSASAAAAAAEVERCAAAAAGLGRTEPPAGFLVYEPKLRTEWLGLHPMEYKGGVPVHHLALMHEQLRQLRSALFLARALNRALVLPRTRCSCELGFFPYHVETHCRANDHPTLPLPYNCSIDHYLDPVALSTSPYAHRERSFLDNPRTPLALMLQTSSKRVRVCAAAEGACAARAGEIVLPAAARVSQLRERLGGEGARLLRVDDVVATFGGFDSQSELVQWHEDAQALLAGWCCTADTRFKRLAGVIPYLLPPLEGQTAWRGHAKLQWAATAVADIFASANDTTRAAALRP